MPSLSDLFPTKINNTIVNDKILTMLAESCSTQAERNNMSNGTGEPFVDGTGLTLTNAAVASGYCANTVGAGLAYGTQQWAAHGVSPYPTATLANAAVLSDGTYIYMIGGAPNGSTNYTVVYRTTLASLQAGTQTWESWGALPSAQGSAMSVLSDGAYVYVIGGYNGSSRYTTVYQTTLASLQAGTQTWVAWGALPTATGGNMSVLSDGTYVYVIGGFTTVDYTVVYRTTLASLQAGTQTWTAHGNLPTAAGDGFATLSDGTYVYVIGGYSGTAGYTVVYRTTLAALQAGTQTWTTHGSLPSGTANAMSVLSDGTYVYVLGGYNGSTYYTTVYKTPLTNINAATILLDEISVTSATAGKIIFTGYNADASEILDVGNTGTNKIEVYPIINEITGNALAFVSESLGDNKWRFTSDEFSLVDATTYGIQFKSFARTIAPNFRIYEALFIWRTGETTVIGSSSDNYEAALYANLLAMTSQQSTDYGLPNGCFWACADATNLTLTNAVVESGYVRNTRIEATLPTNLIPTMTSNTTPSGVASASSVYNTTYAAWRAFNRVITGTDYWASLANATMPQWLRYDFSQSTTITGYRIVKGLLFTAWIFQGSNDGTNWIDLDTQSGQDFTGGLTLTYMLATSVTYSKYRLYITTASDVNVGMYEFELLSVPTEQQINLATIIGNNYTLTNAKAGRLILRAYNADATEALDIGNTGTNKINLYKSIDGNTTWSNALSIESVESLGDNLYRYTTQEIDLSSATGIGFKVQSYARDVAPNFRVLDVLTIWRDEE